MITSIRRALLSILMLGLVLLTLIISTEPGLVILSRAAALIIPGHLRIANTEGTLLDNIHLHDIHYEYNGIELHANDLQLHWAIMRWHPLTIAIPSIEISDFVVKNLQHTTLYTIKKLKIAGQLEASNLNSQWDLLWQGMSIPINTQVDIQLPVGLLHMQGPLMHYTAQGEFYSVGNHFPKSPWQVQAEGDFTKVHVTSLTGNPLQGTATIGGDFAWLPNISWDMSLNAKKIDPTFVLPVISGSLNIIAKSKGLLAELHPHYEFQLEHLSGVLQKQSIQGQGNVLFGDNTYRVDHLALQFGQAILQMHGLINKNLANLNWHLSIPNAKALLKDATGKLQSDGNISGTLKNPHIKMTLLARQLAWDTYKVGQLQATIDAYTNLRDLSQINLTGSNLALNDTVLQNISLQASNQHQQQQLKVSANGQQFNLHASASGLLDGNNWHGQLKDTNVAVPRHGLNVTHINVNIQGNKSTLYYEGGATLGQGQLRINGMTNLEETGFPSTLKITGSNLTVINNTNALVLASPDLICQWDLSAVNLTGKIIIPRARITPIDLTSTVTLPRDVVFVTPEKQQTKKKMNFSSHIQIVLGDDIMLKYANLSSKITGSVNVEDKSNVATLASGILNITNGKYKAYGQDLTIRPSKLIYTGGAIENPGLDIQAVKSLETISMASGDTSKTGGALYTSNQQIVGIKVTGTLTSPHSTLFSEPAGLSQSDILSYLILGRPANQATQKDSASILQALSLLNLGSGASNQLTTQFSNLLGLDQLTLSHEQEYSKATNSVVENTSLLLAKSLSPRLYLSYSLGLIQPINTFKIVYKMTKYFNLQSTHTADANGADVFYTLERE